MALIQITDLTFAYPGSFDNVFEHVSFQFDTDWRLGLTGRNGRGKTTLLRLLQGQYPHPAINGQTVCTEAERSSRFPAKRHSEPDGLHRRSVTIVPCFQQEIMRMLSGLPSHFYGSSLAYGAEKRKHR